MDARVTSFPFNVNDDPMYNGTALMSLGTALWYRTRHGSWLCLATGLFQTGNDTHKVACCFPGSFCRSSSPAGIYLSGFVHLVYRVALAFEG